MVENQTLFIGIDLGGTKIYSGLVDQSGTILAEDYRKTKAKRGVEAVVERLIDSAHAVIQAAGVSLTDIKAVGIGAPGPVESEKGIVNVPPNLPGWERVPLKALVESSLPIPTYLANDANAAALGEYLFGAGRKSRQMLYITVSTGIGGGFILNGKIFQGAAGAAGEVGHMTILPGGPRCGCGNRGCLEAVASGTAIARQARELFSRTTNTLIAELANGDQEAITAKLVAEAAQLGDVWAQEILGSAMGYLGIGVANLVNLLNPDLIVIGGSLTKLGDLLFDPVRRAVAQRSFPVSATAVRIVPATLGDKVGVLGAAAVATQQANRILRTSYD